MPSRRPPNTFSLTPAPRRHAAASAFYFRRAIFLPGDESSQDEGAALGQGAHRLAFIEALFHFERGHYRFDTPTVVAMAALLLRAKRGPLAAAYRDSPVRLARLALSPCPPYATVDVCARHPMHFHGLQAAPDAPHSLELASMISEDMGRLRPDMGELEAEREFLRLARECPLYGSEIFRGQRAWFSPGGAEGARAPVDVLVSIGHHGITLVSQRDPLAAHLSTTWGDIVSWASDRDTLVFTVLDLHEEGGVEVVGPHGAAGAGAAEEGTPVYVHSAAADALQAAVERYVAARVRMQEAYAARGSGSGSGGSGSGSGGSGSSGGGGGSGAVHFSGVAPRNARELGVAPQVTGIRVAPAPEWAGMEGWDGVSPAGVLSGGALVTGSSSSSSSSGGGGGGGGAPAAAASPPRSGASAAAAASPLPMGWARALDERGAHYYFHATTKASTYDHPAFPTGPLPEGWVEAVDPTDASRYFVHGPSRTTTWVRPPVAAAPAAAASPPPAPGPLPPGWREYSDPKDGLPYFYNTVTKKTVWERPS